MHLSKSLRSIIAQGRFAVTELDESESGDAIIQFQFPEGIELTDQDKQSITEFVEYSINNFVDEVRASGLESVVEQYKPSNQLKKKQRD